MNEEILGCSAVNEHVSKPIPSFLWHYTSYAALQGIVRSKKIWATEYRFLNDRAELRHAKQLAQTLVEQQPETVGTFAVRSSLRSAIDGVFTKGTLDEENHCVAVASFSERGDQLSQWRGYANDSRGVSIGFDLRKLRPPSGKGIGVVFAPCLYKHNEKCELLKAIFDHYVNCIREWWDPIVDRARAQRGQITAIELTDIPELISKDSEEVRQRLRPCFAALTYDLMRTAPLLKDESFIEEQEWRLVLPWKSKGGLPKRLEFRCSNGAIVPYIDWPFDLENDQSPVPCRTIMLGPGSHPSAEVGVNLFLKSEQVNVVVQPSQIPYRPT